MSAPRPASSAVRPILPVLAALVGAATALADSEEASSRAYLEATVVTGGQTTLTLHTQPPKNPAVILTGFILVGSGTGPVDLGLAWPILHVDTFATFSGLISPTGTYEVTVPVTTTPYAQGLVVSSTGAIYGGSFAVEVSSAAAPSVWTDLSSALPGLGFATNDVDVGDFDRNGAYDLITASAGLTAHTQLLMNQPGGGFTESSMALLPPEGLATANCVEVADVDGDGWEDVFLGVGKPDSLDPNVLLMNQGGTGFAVHADFPDGVGDAMDAEFGDVNRDGYLDLVVLNRIDLSGPPPYPFPFDPAVLYVWKDGLQNFKEKLNFRAIPGNSALPNDVDGDISLGDVENDGDLDVFVTRADDLQDKLWLNNGNATFTDATSSIPPNTSFSSFEAAFLDANQDDLVDVIVAGLTTKLWINQGGAPPVFTDGSANLFGLMGAFPVSLDVGDVDADGDQDVAMVRHMFADAKTHLFLNQGGIQAGALGQFLDDDEFGPDTDAIQGDVALFDYDGDGDLDAYVGQLNGNDILIRND